MPALQERQEEVIAMQHILVSELTGTVVFKLYLVTFLLDLISEARVELGSNNPVLVMFLRSSRGCLLGSDESFLEPRVELGARVLVAFSPDYLLSLG